jgi:DNA-binding NarL/FixJ family response regulator
MTPVGEAGQAPTQVDTDWDRDPTRRTDDFCTTTSPWGDPSSTPPRPSMAADHEMVTETLRRILATAARVDVVAIATNAAQAVEHALRHEPHVVIMDYRFPDVHQVAGTATDIGGHPPATKVLVVIASDQPDVLDAAFDAGSVRDLEPANELGPLHDTLRSASRANGSRRPLRTLGGRSRDHVGELTRRQAEVLAIMAEGLSDQAIADRLTLSLNTIRTHVQTILRKLDAHSKLEAVALANRRHLFD